MEENKILEILKKVPLGTELYSPAFGKIMFNGIRDSFANEQRIAMSDENEIGIAFLTDGRFKKSGEVMLFPSDKMRNWDKFAWKKGDVLVNSKGIYCLFIEFSGYPYTNFTAMFVNVVGSLIIDSIIKVTQEWHKASSEDAEKYIEYINANLKKVDRKLNLETLEVEKTGFKDGDILTCQATPSCGKSVFIFKGEAVDGYTYHAAIGTSGILCISSGNTWCGKEDNVEYATEAERMKLFDAIVKANKYWNVEKKIIEDIRPVTKRPKPIYKKVSDIPEHEFEPFEKVLVRDQKTDKWAPDLYGSKGKVGRYNYTCIGGLCVYCISYEGNEHLLGTTDDPNQNRHSISIIKS